MKLQRLAITTLPGISESFALDGLAPGINLVTGPNTVGKSSLVRALKYLLREHEKGDPPVSLSAEFSDGAAHWQVQRTGSVTQWTRDGQTVSRPALPDAEELGRYCMSMEDLIAASAGDEALAGELHRALRGGFNLGAARLSIKPRHGNNEDKALKNARNDLRLAEQNASALSKREDQLPALDAEIQEAREAEAQCHRIKRAKELCDVIGERDSLQAALDQLPGDMDKLTGREGEELNELQQRTIKLQHEEREAGHEHERAASEIELLGFTGKNLDAAEQTQTVVEGKLAAITKLRDELKRLREDELGQAARLESASAVLGGDGPPQPDSANLTRAEQFAARLVNLRTARDELETRIELAGTAPDEQKLKQHDKAIEALRDWLRSQSSAPSGGPAKRSLLASLGAGLLAAVAGLLVHPLAGASLMLLSVLLIALALRQLRPAATTRRSVSRERFAETGLENPAEWQEKQVSEKLRELEETAGGLMAAKSRAEGAEGLRIELEKTTGQLNQTEEERQQLGAAIGFDPAMPITALDRFIHLVKDWDRECAALKETKGKIADCEPGIEKATAALGELLTPWTGETQTDADALAAAAESLKSRLRQARKHDADKRDAGARIENIKKQLADCEQGIDRIYLRVGLAGGDETALRERLDRLPLWRETRESLADCKSREAQIRKDLEDSAELCELAEAKNATELDRLFATRQSIAGGLDGLIEQREQTRAEIALAETGETIAEAITNRANAEAALESRRDKLLDALATDLLLDEVEQAYTADHQPEILREAGRLFREVTAHEFDLELGGHSGFQARDRKQNAVRNLNELSTGTRMQLLLAVRTAWVGRQQPLPLFLDEALTTSDEERTSGVVRALLALAEAGGAQVVYFSARRNEAALWRAAAGEGLCVIDLGKARSRAPDAEAATFTLESRPPVPEPSGTPEEYARLLAAPSIDPHRDAGEIHLFHLLRDDLQLLHSLMQDFRLTSLGQAESMLEHQSVNADGAGQAWQARLLTRCKAARAWLDAWRQGRSKRISRNELESSGAVSHTYLDQAVALLNANDIAGEPERLLTKLRASELKGYRQHKVDELETWLQKTGHLDLRPQLSSADRRVQTLRQISFSDQAKAADINRCIDHLEAGMSQANDASRKATH